MLKNYIKVALRQLWKQRFYSLINIFGLATGMTVCLLIGFYVADELSYDRFHKKAERIHRVLTFAKVGESEFNGPISSPALMKDVVAELPDIEAATRLDFRTDQIIQVGDKSVTEPKVVAVDTGFFSIFDYKLIQGNPKTALAEPFTAVLTPESAQRLFGTEEVLNRTFSMNDKEYKVTGIIEAAPANAHFHYGILYSFSSSYKEAITNWGSLNVYTYFLLKEGTQVAEFDKKLNGLFPKYFEDYESFIKLEASWSMAMQPMTDIHLKSHYMGEIEPGGDIRYVYIFLSVALFIVVLACINFMNLATARSAHRAKEMGVRKVMGSMRQALIGQFLTEAILLSSIAVVLSIGMVELAKGYFNEVSGKLLTMNILDSPLNLMFILSFALLVGLAAGSYPAFYLTSFQPIQVLKGTFKAGKGSATFRNGLVVFQFVISIGLIVCTLMVNNQLQYMSHKKLGMDKENVLVVANLDKLKENKASFLERLKGERTVVSATHAEASAFSNYDGTYFALPEDEDNGQIFNFTQVGNDYIQTLGIEMKEGRAFTEQFVDTASAILNESAVKRLGMEDPVGKKILINGDRYLTVVGVMKDYHFQSLHSPILPLVLEKGNVTSQALVRIQAGDYSESIAAIENLWNEYAPGIPFHYTFVDQEFEKLFQSEQKLGRLFIGFISFAIFIACLGVFALSAYTAEQRTKEIGVRKVLGASEMNLLLLLTKDFTKLVILALLIASPLAYLAINHWLNDFAYRVSIQPSVFVLAAGIAVSLALLTVLFQSLKAAKANPVKSLKSE
ncbi:ABC transporter permease [Cytophagales bacterium LB-30]|uniref:ABC transporter permease n=1 Tax=Shiella aurantiaca TaxID=3058365 RepID=A0ABT8F3S3_9BACT|nr:ABC transporter permease [Shiella aurantiaca]MDN4165077.1 ABC transporter permease [Shiella aurantiaca]